MNFGISKPIYYYNSEGKANLPKTIELVIDRSKENNINHIIIFTADGEGAFKLKEMLGDTEINIYAATFPYRQVFSSKDPNGNTIKVVPQTSLPEIREEFKRLGIRLVQGVMPLQDIIIPNAKDVKNQTIHYTLSLISGGLRLCVQAILMAVDGGHIEPGETVIAMSADTAIVAKSSLSTWLFHPTEGLEINEIICKPSKFTITHSTEK